MGTLKIKVIARTHIKSLKKLEFEEEYNLKPTKAQSAKTESLTQESELGL